MILSEPVALALRQNRPVVALESTIVAHGMPYPQNLETARAVEAAVQERGAVPATIAVWDGVPRIGLDDHELEALARTDGVWKVSRRDLPYVMAQKRHGATTVASTMILAAKAGIRVFATGGIGGVHRGAERTFDISADLMELARTPVAVVSAGAKAILDLGLTLEYLETQGVPVIGYQTHDFPAFYTRSSGHTLELRTDTPEELAAVLRAQWALGLEGGALVANPIPEAFALDAADIEAAIAAAVGEAEQQGIQGKALTPFLLSRIKHLTEGRSLEANIQLVLHNARLAADLAGALARE
jgi:pseudouridine-5'-phosphate glycosidase